MDNTFRFDDMDDGDEATVIVRAVRGGVGLTVSKKADGDVEVFIPSGASSNTLDVASTKHLPPCPECGNGEWETVSGGDSADDPYRS